MQRIHHGRWHRGLFFFILIITFSLPFFFILFEYVDDSPNNFTIQNNDQIKSLKVITTKQGMHGILIDDLREAANNRSIDSPNVRLYNEGIEQSFWIQKLNGQKFLLFYAQSKRNVYTDENVYWIVLDDDIPSWVEWGNREIDFSERNEINDEIRLIDPPPRGGYIEVIYLEENNKYKPQVEQADHWFWKSMYAPQQEQFLFDVSNVLNGTGAVEINLWSSTDSAEELDHHLLVSINGIEVINEQWDGVGSKTLRGTFKSDILNNGQNSIELHLLDNSNANVDIVNLNWIDIFYPKKLSSENDAVRLAGTGKTEKLTGFSYPVSIYDTSDPASVIRLEVITEGPVIIEGIAGHQYSVVGSGGYIQPDRINKPSNFTDLRENRDGAEYIAIAPENFQESIDPLLKLRERQGISTIFVPIEAIYDQFGEGMPSPEGIRNYLKYARENWSQTPMYLLLVGDASYDPKGYISDPSVNVLPVFMVDTIFGGQTGSDLGYAQLDTKFWNSSDDHSNGKSSLAVGRIPASTPDEVSALVGKILAYESGLDAVVQSDDSSQRITAIADNQSTSFEVDADKFLSMFPQNFETILVSPVVDDPQANQTILDNLNQSNLFVAYFGHGSINMWGKERLFHSEDVSEFVPVDGYPIILNFTCLTGLFTHPESESITETMLWEHQGGAVAVFAPTSLTLSNDQSYLVESFVESYLSSSAQTLGELIRTARNNVPEETPGQRDVLNTFLLFGDPALRLPPSH